MLFLLLISYRLSFKKKEHKIIPNYIYAGELKVEKTGLFRENIDTCAPCGAGLEERLGVYHHREGLVSSPRVAYEIANAILTEVYGESDMNMQRPLKIRLVNNKYWRVDGQFNPKIPNLCGGSPTIIIKKSDAQIQYIMHTK